MKNPQYIPTGGRGSGRTYRMLSKIMLEILIATAPQSIVVFFKTGAASEEAMRMFVDMAKVSPMMWTVWQDKRVTLEDRGRMFTVYFREQMLQPERNFPRGSYAHIWDHSCHE